mmetsp:Transcript_24560/g.54701  ORF Transcript_24560/g.54701 Transcript_24560/m.54701 type:complete len:114 (+) Transcript_24560:241-582(+)
MQVRLGGYEECSAVWSMILKPLPRTVPDTRTTTIGVEGHFNDQDRDWRPAWPEVADQRQCEKMTGCIRFSALSWTAASEVFAADFDLTQRQPILMTIRYPSPWPWTSTARHWQ